MKVLALNAGSSSLKYQLVESDSEEVLARGLCERIGIDGRLVAKRGDEKRVVDASLADHADALKAIFSELVDGPWGVLGSLAEVGAVGHRVVHGGDFSDSALVTPESLAVFEDLVDLAPLHNGPEVACIESCLELMPGVPQVAVFDTAFHQTMPPEAYTYAIPYELSELHGLRRYGFHGTSHRFVAARAAELLGRPLAELRLVTCHLGNGSSLAAVDRGRSVDTSMGFTPGAGLVMGTRCGDIDPFIVGFVTKRLGLTAHEVDELLNKQSGLLGVSGVSSDFRDVEAAAEEGSPRAQLALAMFARSVYKTIGAYAAVMNGVDALVFTAGVGENDHLMRSAICANLGYLGVELDEGVNLRTRGTETFISREGSRTPVLVVPTNEELEIVRETVTVASEAGDGAPAVA